MKPPSFETNLETGRLVVQYVRSFEKRRSEKFRLFPVRRETAAVSDGFAANLSQTGKVFAAKARNNETVGKKTRST